MQEKLKKIKQEIIKELERTKTLEQLESVKNRYFGRKGDFSLLIKDVRNLAAEQKPVVGKLINDVRVETDKLIDEIIAKLGKKQETRNQNSDACFDITIPGKKQDVGKSHPLTQIRREVEEVFKSMGFRIADGPELESEWYNFEAINIPEYHPARDMQDTFYVKFKSQISNLKTNLESKSQDNKLVMRTHTSNVQVRAMEKYGVPIKCIVPGRVYRNEATDARHEHTFHQIEGLVVDKDISIANLKATVDIVIKAILGAEYETRIRPGYFPFVEPGLEVDLSCNLCRGAGCRVCKGSGWVEWMGAGMVHPRVLESAKVDPQEYSGFAFGFGLERLAMMKWGINDIRLFHSGDLRFLRQF